MTSREALGSSDVTNNSPNWLQRTGEISAITGVGVAALGSCVVIFSGLEPIPLGIGMAGVGVGLTTVGVAAWCLGLSRNASVPATTEASITIAKPAAA